MIGYSLPLTGETNYLIPMLALIILAVAAIVIKLITGKKPKE